MGGPRASNPRPAAAQRGPVGLVPAHFVPRLHAGNSGWGEACEGGGVSKRGLWSDACAADQREVVYQTKIGRSIYIKTLPENYYDVLQGW